MGIGRFAFTPLLPMMQESHNVSVAAGGWLASTNYLGYLIGALSAIALRAEPAKVIRFGLIATAAVTFAMGVTDNFTAWAILRLLAGVASAWVLVFVSAWAFGLLASRDRSELGGVVFTGVGIGIMMAGLLCLLFMHLHVDADTTWMVFGALSLALTLLIWRVFDTPSAAAKVNTTTATPPPRSNNDAIRLIVCYGVFGFGYIIPATFIPAMAKQIIPDPAIFGWSWPAFGLAATLSTLAIVVLRRYAGIRQLWIIGQILLAIGVILPVFSSDITAIIFAALLVGGTFVVITMVALQEAREIVGQHPQRLIAAMTASFATGQILGPIGASYALQRYRSFSVVLLGASLLLVISALLLYHSRRQVRGRA